MPPPSARTTAESLQAVEQGVYVCFCFCFCFCTGNVWSISSTAAIALQWGRLDSQLTLQSTVVRVPALLIGQVDGIKQLPPLMVYVGRCRDVDSPHPPLALPVQSLASADRIRGTLAPANVPAVLCTSAPPFL